MSNDYLRNRPFLAVELLSRPSSGTNTRKKNWQKEAGAMQTYEIVHFVDRISDKSKYYIIIDIINSAVIQNKSTKSENEIMASFLGRYRDKVTQALTVWAQKEAKNLAE